jgi:DNA polymerase I-like protein with 3'-5' exonuclease and polymerase domains
MKRKFRDLLVAPKGKTIIAADLSQAETWIVAYSANEDNMKFALKYGDIHAQTASLIYFPQQQENHEWKKVNGHYICKNCGVDISYEMRYLGKKCNHGTSYRMKAKQQATSINKESDQPPYLIVTEKQCEGYQAAWHGYYNIRNWWYDIENQLDKDRTLTTPYNRQRTFYGNLSNPYERAETLKAATAFAPQSTVCDHFTGKVQDELGIEGGLLKIYSNIVKKSKGEVELVNMSHDSCVLYVPNQMVNEVALESKSYLLRPLIVKGEEFTIPVDVEVGERYGSLEKLKEAA